MIGTTVGNYRILERIGDGGMGTVYRGLDEMLDREVALKVMRPDLARQAALSERFRQEAVALARLSHPNIAAVFGLERSGSDAVLVMEFIRGETLESIVQRSGRLAWPRALELAAAVADALDHAHDKGVVHRDIKPANIMLTRDGVVKVMDFGIARILGRSRQTRVGAAVGTPMYMSPEQLRGEEVDGRSDLYSLGAVVYELITGRVAFEADSDYELMMKQLHEPAPPVREAVPDVPDAVDALIQHAMAKQPQDRAPNARALAASFRATIAAQGTAPSRPAPATRLADVAPPTPARAAATPPVAVTADHPVAAVPVTQLADVVPSRDARHSIGTGDRVRAWLEDWRTWAGTAGLFAVLAVALRILNPNDTPARTGGDDKPDTAAVVPQAPDSARTPETPATVPAADLPPAGGVVPAPIDPPERVVTLRPAERAAAPVRPPKSGKVAPTPQGGTDPKPSSVAEPEPQTPVRPQPPEPEERTPPDNGRAASAGIAEALDRFADAVGSGNTSFVGSVLQGGAEAQWISLMREGRLSMSLSGAPDIDVDGSRATARFAATLTARTAFGANRKSSASFVADLERSGNSWRLRSLRPSGKLDLK